MTTSWNHPTKIARTEQLIREGGFAKEHRYNIEIYLTEAESTAVYASKKQPYKDCDILLLCDAGGWITNINIFGIFKVGQTTPLSYAEGRRMGSNFLPIGSKLIDIMVHNLITARLESTRHIIAAKFRDVGREHDGNQPVRHFQIHKEDDGNQSLRHFQMVLRMGGNERARSFSVRQRITGRSRFPPSSYSGLENAHYLGRFCRTFSISRSGALCI